MRPWKGWPVVLLAGLVSLGLTGCGASPSSTSIGSPAASASPGPATGPSPSAAPGPTPGPTVGVVRDIAYYREADGRERRLDVYVPPGRGPWPTVVMLHGGGGFPLLPAPDGVSAAGAVVFAPPWSDSSPWPDVAAFRADTRHGLGVLACAVRFARANAATYGGAPDRLVLYGHSAGANLAAMIGLAAPEPGEGCLAASGSVVPEKLVLFEGDWLSIGNPMWDTLLREAGNVLDVATPWSYLEAAPRLPIVLLDSNDDSMVRADVDALLDLRDSTGELRRGLEALGLLADGSLSETDQQRLLLARLVRLGFPATLIDLPGSAHRFISDEARPSVLRAIVEVVG